MIEPRVGGTVIATSTHKPYITKNKIYTIVKADGTDQTVRFVDDRGYEVWCALIPDWIKLFNPKNKIGGEIL